jgi:hypothetical protein
MTTTSTWVDLALTSDSWFAALSSTTYKANPMSIKVGNLTAHTRTHHITCVIDFGFGPSGDICPR